MCKVLQHILPLKSHIVYEHIGGTLEQQTEFLKTYEKYLNIRDELLEGSSIDSSLPGLYSGPAPLQAASRRLASGSSATVNSG